MRKKTNDEVRASNRRAQRGSDGSRQTIAGSRNDPRMQGAANAHRQWVNPRHGRDEADNRWMLSGPNRRAQNN